MKITIAGLPAEGKTTVALIIEHALHMAGIKVENHDNDVVYGSSYPELQDKREAVLAERGLIVVIETTQLRKGQ